MAENSTNSLQDLLGNLQQPTLGGKPSSTLSETPSAPSRDDGSKPFTTLDSTFLEQHLSGSDLEILAAQMDQGADFSHLTEGEVRSLFL